VHRTPTAHLEAVDPRQHHIGHDDVHRRIADAVKGRLTGRGKMHTIAETAQSQIQTLPDTGSSSTSSTVAITRQSVVTAQNDIPGDDPPTSVPISRIP
jgi:hypothetical protein